MKRTFWRLQPFGRKKRKWIGVERIVSWSCISNELGGQSIKQSRRRGFDRETGPTALSLKRSIRVKSSGQTWEEAERREVGLGELRQTNGSLNGAKGEDVSADRCTLKVHSVPSSGWCETKGARTKDLTGAQGGSHLRTWNDETDKGETFTSQGGREQGCRDIGPRPQPEKRDLCIYSRFWEPVRGLRSGRGSKSKSISGERNEHRIR